MNEKEKLKIRLLLSDEKYLADSLIPIACFSISNILEQINKYAATEDAFELAKLEISILAFCSGCKGNKDLRFYIVELEKLLSLGTIKEVLGKCQELFKIMHESYVKREKYQSTVTVMEALA